jgi:hypothetical protein
LWGKGSCQSRLLSKLYLKYKHLAFKVIFDLAKSQGHPQYLLFLVHISKLSVCSTSPPHSCSCSTRGSSQHSTAVTLATPSMLSWMQSPWKSPLSSLPPHHALYVIWSLWQLSTRNTNVIPKTPTQIFLFLLIINLHITMFCVSLIPP